MILKLDKLYGDQAHKHFLLCLTFTFTTLAYYQTDETLVNVREDIENMIANDKGFENVILTMPNTFGGFDKYQLVDYKYDQLPKKVIITLKDFNQNILTTKAKFDEAIIIPVSNTIILKGNVINNDQLTEVKYPKIRETKNLIIDNKQLIGLVAKKNLLPLRIITKQDILNPIVVDKGQIVKIVYLKNRISIESKAIALEQGSLDEFIKVRNIEGNNKDFNRPYH